MLLKINSVLLFIVVVPLSLLGQHTDSIVFLNELELFTRKAGPIEQIARTDSLMAVWRTNEKERTRKNIQLFSLIYKINKDSLPVVRKDTSGLILADTTFSADVTYSLLLNRDVNFDSVQKITGIDVYKEFPRFFDFISKGSIALTKGMPGVGDVAKGGGGGGIQMPPMFSLTPGTDYKMLALQFYQAILQHMHKTQCPSKFLKWYEQANEKGVTDWQIIAEKRRVFLGFIQNKCPI